MTIVPVSAATVNLETLLSRIADNPVLLARVACLLLAKGQSERARELCRRAVAMAPDNAEVFALSAEIHSHDVPGWHFYMVRDSARNAAYEAALRRAIRPDCYVLEIGSGSGLLAMMAARVGAAVVTCECNGTIAAAASEIILRNGFSDRVRLVAKHSADLAVGVDLVRPADVVVSEIVSNNMVGEGVLQAIEQTVRRLTQPKAQIIPARGVIRIALAEDRQAHRHQMAQVEGFDLSPFNRLAAPCYQIRVGDDRLMLRSEPGDLFRFDFQSGGPFPESRAVAPLLAKGGRVNGIAQWIRLEMDDEVNYENSPAAGTTSAWDVLFYPLMRPAESEGGEILTVHGAHDRATLRVWAEVPQLP